MCSAFVMILHAEDTSVPVRLQRRFYKVGSTGPLIVTHICIFYLIIPMHFDNKYMIFTHLLYIFAGTHSKGEIAK